MNRLNRAVFILGIAGFFLCVGTVAMAGTSQGNSDLFGELDDAMTMDMLNDDSLFDDTSTGMSSQDKGFLGSLWDNAEYKLVWRSSTFFDKAESRVGIDNNFYMTDARFELETSWSKDDHTFGMQLWTEVGSQKDTYDMRDYYWGAHRARADIERNRRYFELNELYWIETVGDFDFTIGKKVVDMGVTPLYSPTNRISPADLNDPSNPKPYGVWQATADYYRGDSTYTLSVMPFFVPTKLPGKSSRWSGNSAGGTLNAGGGVPDGVGSADFQFFDLEIDPGSRVGEDVPGNENTIQVLMKAKTTFKGWDLFIAGFNGIAPFPVLRRGSPDRGETAFVREYVPATTASLGYSTTKGKFEFHGEALSQFTHYQRDDDYLTYVTGVTYTEDEFIKKLGGDRMEFTIDYAGEEKFHRQDRAGYLDSSRNARQGQRDLMMRWYCKYNEGLKFGALMNINLDDDGRTYTFGFERKLATGLIFKTSVEFFHGPEDSFYGRWDKNNRLLTTLEYSF